MHQLAFLISGTLGYRGKEKTDRERERKRERERERERESALSRTFIRRLNERKNLKIRAILTWSQVKLQFLAKLRLKYFLRLDVRSYSFPVYSRI